MKIMGLDISTTSTGVVMFDTDFFEHPDVGVKPIIAVPLVPPAKEKMDVIGRGTYMLEKLHPILDKYKPELILIEDYAFASNKLAPQAEVKGILLFCMRSLGLKWNLVAPQRLKKYVGAKDKSETRLQTYKRWGFEDKSDDVVDAYVLARIGLGLVGMEPLSLTKFQIEVLEALAA